MVFTLGSKLVTSDKVNDLFVSEDRFLLVATSSGIEIVDLFYGNVISSGTLMFEPLSIAADWQSPFGKLYVGTSGGGIFGMNYNAAKELGVDFSSSLSQDFTTTSPIALSSNVINDIDTLPQKLLIGTDSGIDFIYKNSLGSQRLIDGGSNQVRLSETGSAYWITASGNNQGAVQVNYDILTTTGTGNLNLDFEYTLLSNPALPTEPPLDISLSKRENKNLALAVVTSGGIFVTEEFPMNESLSPNKILSSESFLAVDFCPNSSFNQGCLNAASLARLTVFDLTNDSVSAVHSATVGARGQNLIFGDIGALKAVKTSI